MATPSFLSSTGLATTRGSFWPSGPREKQIAAVQVQRVPSQSAQMVGPTLLFVSTGGATERHDSLQNARPAHTRLDPVSVSSTRPSGPLFIPSCPCPKYIPIVVSSWPAVSPSTDASSLPLLCTGPPYRSIFDLNLLVRGLEKHGAWPRS
jgi:hypothetical protein